MMRIKIIFWGFTIFFILISGTIVAQRILETGRNEKTKTQHLIENKIIKRKLKNVRDKNNHTRESRITKRRKIKKRIGRKPIHKKKIVRRLPYKRPSRPTPIDNHYYDNDYYNNDEETYLNENYIISTPIEDEEVFNPYPNFPLQFINGKITYLYSYEAYNTDNQLRNIYNLKIDLKVTSDDYLNPFGVLLEYSDGTKQLEIFNEEGRILYWDMVYTFNREIELHQLGYINLKIGYYDLDNNKFYPAKIKTNKTDLLLYVVLDK
jgi:hypothetical protein